MHLSGGSVSTSSKLIPSAALHDEGVPKKTPLMPQRSPPPPPSSREQIRNISPQSEKEMQQSRPSQGTLKASGGGGGPIGAFWSTQHAQDSLVIEDKGPLFDKEQINQNTTVRSQNSLGNRPSPPSEHHIGPEYPLRWSGNENSSKMFEDGPTKDFEINFFPDNSKNGSQKVRASHSESKATFQNQAFNTFVAEFDTNKLNSGNSDTIINNSRSRKEELEAVDKLKEQLKQANLEKAEITSKYEKLSAICRSQRQELQELKRSLAAATPSPPNKDSSRSQIPMGSLQSSTPQRDKVEGGLWELQQGMFANSSASPSPEPKAWQAFAEEPKAQPSPVSNHARSVWTASSRQNITTLSAAGPANDIWGFGLDSLASSPAGPQISRTCVQGNASQRFGGGGEKVETSQPAGWAGF